MSLTRLWLCRRTSKKASGRQVEFIWLLFATNSFKITFDEFAFSFNIFRRCISALEYPGMKTNKNVALYFLSVVGKSESQLRGTVNVMSDLCDHIIIVTSFESSWTTTKVPVAAAAAAAAAAVVALRINRTQVRRLCGRQRQVRISRHRSQLLQQFQVITVSICYILERDDIELYY